MKRILILLSIFTIILSCKKDDEGDDIDCSGLSVEVTNWTNNFNAIATVNDGSDPYSYNYEWSNGETGTIIGGSEGTLEPGTYTVTVTDENGCTASDSITISYAVATIEYSLC